MKTKRQIPTTILNIGEEESSDPIFYWAFPYNPLLPSTYIYVSFDKRARNYIANDHKFLLNDINTVKSGAMSEILFEDTHDQVITITINRPIPKTNKDILNTTHVIVHESSHAVTCIMERYGYMDDELRSYLMDYFINTYIEMLWDNIHNKTIKNIKR